MDKARLVRRTVLVAGAGVLVLAGMGWLSIHGRAEGGEGPKEGAREGNKEGEGKLAATQPKLTDDEKIERLIKAVSDLQDAVFIRQGQEYGAGAAAIFLRAKMNSMKDQVKTAQDFVKMGSAGNFGTGQTYFVKFKDGKQVPAGELLGAELAKMEGKVVEKAGEKGDVKVEAGGGAKTEEKPAAKAAE